jgi:hypothetical protein
VIPHLYPGFLDGMSGNRKRFDQCPSSDVTLAGNLKTRCWSATK